MSDVTEGKSARLSHAERCGRRRAMAEAVGRGEGLGAVAIEFGVTIRTVEEACQEHGVPVVPRVDGRPGSLPIVAALQNTDDPIAAVAARLGVTRQRVAAVLKLAREAGIRFPGRDGSGE